MTRHDNQLLNVGGGCDDGRTQKTVRGQGGQELAGDCRADEGGVSQRGWDSERPELH